MAVYIYVGLCVLFAALTMIANAKKLAALKLVFKTTASVCFVLVGGASLMQSDYAIWQILIIFGLVFGLVGDIFLSVDSPVEQEERMFDAFGTASFVVGHVCYITAFLYITLSFDFILLPIALSLPIALFLLQSFNVIKMEKAVRIGSLFYALIIGTMLACAVNVYLCAEKSLSSVYVLWGAVLFTLSDAALAFEYFNPKLKGNRILALSLAFYYAGQLLFGLSVGT